MKKLLVIIEQTGTGFSAYIPDLPGCIATGPGRQTVKKRIKEAAEFHLEGLKAGGRDLPAMTAESDYIEIVSQ